jgi:uncharacterized protein YodC (DUF2158 family)
VSAPFKVGDLVRLKNPWGPVMTVSDFAPEESSNNSANWDVWCVWFDTRSRLQKEIIPSDLLELAGPA